MKSWQQRHHEEIQEAFTRLVGDVPLSNMRDNWPEQCLAAQAIRKRFGPTRALQYIVGQKLLNFLSVANADHDYAVEAAAFTEAITKIFPPWEVDEYLRTMERSSSLAPPRRDNTILRLIFLGTLEQKPTRYQLQ